MSDFLLKNEKRRMHECLNKSRILRGRCIIASSSLWDSCISSEAGLHYDFCGL